MIAKGRTFYYFHKFRGTDRETKAIRLPDDPTLPEWWTAYGAAANVKLPLPPPQPNTVGQLIDDYQAAPEWTSLADRTRVEWSRYLDRVRESWGPLQVRGLEPRHVLDMRDRYSDTPAAANNLLRALSSMLSWSVPRGWRSDNPCDHVKKLKGGEYEPWTRREIEFFCKHARADLGYATKLAFHTGQRQRDVVEARRSDIRDGEIRVVQHKTGRSLWIPLHPELKRMLAEMPRNSLYLLTSTRGTPWTQDGFRASWQAEMDRRIFAPLRRRRRVFHGLRKSAVCSLLECGCTDAEVAAITGQSRQMIELYAKMVNQPKLARAAVLKWQRADAARTKNEPKA